jgi:hypothetical protein
MTDIPETVPDFWAVHSGNGSHIGLWPSEGMALDAAREYDGSVVTPLYRASRALPHGDTAAVAHVDASGPMLGVMWVSAEKALTFQHGMPLYAAPVAPSVEREAVAPLDWKYLANVLRTHKEKFPVPAHLDKYIDALETIAPKREAVDADLVRRAEADVLAERERQRMKKGWTSDHDDEHRQGQMARAAAAYAYFGSLPDIDKLAEKDRTRGSQQGSFVHFIVSQLFPAWGTAYGGWGWEWWKPTNRRRDLVKAGALIIAEIERLDRLDALSSRGAE